MHYTIVPIKSLGNSKKRLESFLSPSERRELGLALIEDVLTAATNSRLSDGTLIITPDTEIITRIHHWNFPNIECILESEERGINQAVQLAIRWCLSKSVSSILVIPADLALITSDEIDALLQLGRSGYSIIIAPSQRKDGTNAFYQQPPNRIQVWYGPNSFQKNLTLVSQSPHPYRILENSAFALDIDLKEDLEQLQQIKIHSKTAEFIKTLNLSSNK